MVKDPSEKTVGELEIHLLAGQLIAASRNPVTTIGDVEAGVSLDYTARPCPFKRTKIKKCVFIVVLEKLFSWGPDFFASGVLAIKKGYIGAVCLSVLVLHLGFL